MAPLRALFAVLTLSACHAGTAPSDDKSKHYPEGWCDTQYGTPTRTTGECMCKFECEGGGCERQQGFIWYSYAKCKTCKCVAAKAAPAGGGDDEPDGGDDDYDDGEEGYVPYEEPVVEEVLSFGEKVFEFVDENGNAIFAVVFTLVLLCIMVPALVLTTASGHKQGEAAAPKKKAEAPPAKATAKDDDDSDDDEPEEKPKARKRTPKAD